MDELAISPEEAALFNPAFIGLLIAIGARNYRNAKGEPMPWLFSFLLVPLVLNTETRSRLPSTTNAMLSIWVLRHPLTQLAFPDRAVAATPLVREGIRFAIRTGALTVSGDGLDAAINPRAWERLATADARDCGKNAGFVGRWLAKADLPTAFSLLGVRP